MNMQVRESVSHPSDSGSSTKTNRVVLSCGAEIQVWDGFPLASGFSAIGRHIMRIQSLGALHLDRFRLSLAKMSR